MERFQRNELSILVATTVIEVGVDVPNATIMIIEHAERFGLSQLHQLRGRVGRGSQRSACLLLHGDKLTEMAEARLKTIRSTEDGFEIAERDLELRGQGDLLGTRQSGMPGLESQFRTFTRTCLKLRTKMQLMFWNAIRVYKEMKVKQSERCCICSAKT